MIGTFLHLFGIDTTTGPWYAFWSGAGSDLAYLGVFWALWRHTNCHQPRCWRVGRLPVQGTAYRVCRHHHPNPPGKDTIRERYHIYAGRRPGRG